MVRWVQLGNDLESGKQVANLIKAMFHSQLAEGMVGEGLPASTRKLNLWQFVSVSYRYNHRLMYLGGKYPEQHPHKSNNNSFHNTKKH